MNGCCSEKMLRNLNIVIPNLLGTTNREMRLPLKAQPPVRRIKFLNIRFL